MAKKAKKKSTVSAQPTMDRKWEVQSAADTLIRALEVKDNRSLYKAAKSELKKREKAIKKVIKRT